MSQFEPFEPISFSIRTQGWLFAILQGTNSKNTAVASEPHGKNTLPQKDPQNSRGRSRKPRQALYGPEKVRRAREKKSSNKSVKLTNSLTLSFFGFGLFRDTNSAHAVMTSSRLHFTLDKTALTCCIHSLRDMQSLPSDAIRSSCTSEWTSVLRRLRRHSRTVQEEYMHAQ